MMNIIIPSLEIVNENPIAATHASPDHHMPKQNNHPAFPVQGYPGDAKNPSVRPNTGMGIVDWFAAMALIGYRSSDKYCEEHPDIVADLAYQDAEAMVDRKEKEIAKRNGDVTLTPEAAPEQAQEEPKS